MVSLQRNVWTVLSDLYFFAGSLRRNLDPFAQHDDATLNDALRASGLFSLQADGDEARLTLDSDIASGGNNLSVGQRQIIALARAIVRNSKLLILDEGEAICCLLISLIIENSFSFFFFVVATSAIGMSSKFKLWENSIMFFV